MSEEKLYAKLLAAARKNPPDGQAPYAFEKRVISRLEARSAPSVWSLWCRPLWQAALSCVAITALCGLWAYGIRPHNQPADNFSQDFEAAVFAPVSQQMEDSW